MCHVCVKCALNPPPPTLIQAFKQAHASALQTGIICVYICTYTLLHACCLEHSEWRICNMVCSIHDRYVFGLKRAAKAMCECHSKIQFCVPLSAQIACVARLFNVVIESKLVTEERYIPARLASSSSPSLCRVQIAKHILSISSSNGERKIFRIFA